MATYFMEHTVTMYYFEALEADSLEDARNMRDNCTSEYYEHLVDKLRRKPTKDELATNIDYVDCDVVDWPYDGPVVSRAEFIRRYTSLEE